MIDRIRIWVVPTDKPTTVTLFGGLVDPANSDKPKPPEDCDCHGLVREMKSAELPPHVSAVDFNNVRWSVPGGADAQFGVHAAGVRLQTYVLPGERDHLRLFETSGKFRSMFESTGKPRRIAVQVWAHLSVEVSIQSRQSALHVVVKGTPAFDVNQIDRKTIRLANVAPQTAARSEGGALVFDVPKASVPNANGGTVCVSGTRVDGVQFEGCALLPR